MKEACSFNTSAVTTENTSNLMMAACSQNVLFDMKNKHFRNSGIICVKVMIQSLYKLYPVSTNGVLICPLIYLISMCFKVLCYLLLLLFHKSVFVWAFWNYELVTNGSFIYVCILIYV
jgi:hypothetical protein